MIDAAAQFWTWVGLVAFVTGLVFVAALAFAAILGLAVGLIEWAHWYAMRAMAVNYNRDSAE